MSKRISEKELEDWICQNPQTVFDKDARILGRQVPVDSGRIDLLIFCRRLYIVELKAKKLTEKDVGQILRYTFDVREELKRTAYIRSPFPKPKQGTVDNNTQKSQREHYFLKHGWHERSDNYSTATVSPILIGQGSTTNVIKASEAARIDVYHWHYNTKEKKFEIMLAHIPHSPWYKKQRSVPDWAWEINQSAVVSATINYPPDETVLDFTFDN